MQVFHMGRNQMNSSIRISKTSPENVFRILCLLLWCQDSVWVFFIQLVEEIPFVGKSLGAALTPFLFSVLILLSISYIFKNIRACDLLIYTSIVIYVFISLIFCVDSAIYIKRDLSRILVKSVAVFFVGLSFDFDKQKKELFVASVLSVLLTVIWQLLKMLRGKNLIADNMGAAYTVLPSILLIISIAAEKRKIGYWFLAVFSALSILIYGTRGPVMICLIFIVTVYTINTWVYNTNAIRKLISVVLAASAFVLATGTTVINKVALWFSETLRGLGFSTRVLEKFLDGTITVSKGRDAISETLLDAIAKKPLGYGLMADRYFTGGTYAHNIVLEIWVDFGIVFGSFLLLLFFLLPLCVIFMRIRHRKDCTILILLSCCSFIKLMFSGSFLVEPMLFLLLGICVSEIRKKQLDNYCGLDGIHRTTYQR